MADKTNSSDVAGKSDIGQESSLYEVYPNPTEAIAMVTIDQQTLTQRPQLYISDISGRVLHHASISHTHTIIDMQEYVSGTYYIVLKYQDQVVSKKLVKVE